MGPPQPPGASRGLQGPPGLRVSRSFEGPPAASAYKGSPQPPPQTGALRPPGLQRGLQDSETSTNLQVFPRRLSRCLQGPPKMWGTLFRDLSLGFGVFPSRGKSMYIFGPLRWLEAGLCLPMCGKSLEGLYTSTLHRLLPSSYPVRVYRLTCIFSV